MTDEAKIHAATALEGIVDRMRTAEENYELLASEMVYEGNSVSWWCSKAKRYKASLGDAWDALREAGVHPGDGKDVAAGIRELAAKVREQS